MAGKKSGQKKPGGNKPGQNKPGGNKPGQNKPGGNKPGQNKPGENKPGQNKPGENKPGQNKPGENKPGQNKPGGNKPGQNKPGENKPGGVPNIAQENKLIEQQRAADEAAGLAMAQQLYGPGGQLARTQEEKDILAMRQQQLAQAGQETEQAAAAREALKAGITGVYDPMKDARVQELLQKHVAGLEGASAEENQALRAQMIRSQEGGLAGALRGMKAVAGASGVTGKAAAGSAANLYRDAMIARALGESDLTARNIELKQRALSNYTGALTGFTGQSLEAGQEVGRRLGQYGQYTATMEGQRQQAMQHAADALSQDTLGMAGAEREAWLQAYLGGQGLQMARRGDIRGERLARAGLRIAERAL